MINKTKKNIITNLKYNLNIFSESSNKIRYKLNNNTTDLKNFKRFIAFLATTDFILSLGTLSLIIDKQIMPRYHERVSNTSDLYKSINSNENLDDKEKEILTYVSDFISDYYYYMDDEDVNQKLSTFDIKYEETSDNHLAGTWNSWFNEMTFYNCDYSVELNSNQDVVSHELYHLLSGDIYNPCLREGITSLINYEYSNYQNTDGYFKQLLMSQILCEIIDPELIIKSYLQSDISILKTELLKIDDDKSRFKRLLNNMENYQLLFDQYLNYVEVELDEITYNEYLQLKDCKQNLLDSIKEDLQFYYQQSGKESNSELVNNYLEKLVFDYDKIIENDNKKVVYICDRNIPSNYFTKQDNKQLIKK